MADSDRFTATADQMLRLARSATTEFERNGYLELSRAWRRLAGDAAEVEERKQAAAGRRPARDSQER
jgi:hypothetical protein